MKHIFIIICSIILFAKIPSSIQASDICPFEKTQYTWSPQLYVNRLFEKIFPLLLIEPTDQIKFHISYADYHRDLAEKFITENPSLGYTEFMRAIHNLTLLEKPIRQNNHSTAIPYESIMKSLSNIQSTLILYQDMYNQTCNEQLTNLSNFLARDKKTLTKIYYESLLIKP